MKSSITTTPLESVATPLLAIATCEVDGVVPDGLQALDDTTGGALSRVISSGDFRGTADQTALVYPSGTSAERIVLVGLGKATELTRGAVRRAGAIAARQATQLKTASLAFAVGPQLQSGVPPDQRTQALIEGVAQGGWQFLEFKATNSETPVELSEVIVSVETEDERDAEIGRARGAAMAAGHVLARNLQMEPGNVCTPAYLAKQAQDLAKKHGFDVAVLDQSAIEREGMGALLAVAKGSVQEPRFVELQYRGAGDDDPVVLIGKGVTFDSGGISIKPALNMEEMKYDMSGAAAVLGAFEVLGQLKPKVNVVGLIPSAENMPSPSAFKPGDVVRSHLGKTIEIVNTDAEGRMILSDALSYARRFNPACVIDAATLTGAVIIALGHDASGLMGNDDQLVEDVRAAGDRAGERCWQLPLWEEYRQLLKSDIADIKNIGGRPASSITAAWFLREFVGEFPWAHLDIAGTAWTDKAQPAWARGPTGVGVRLFVEFILHRAKA